MQTPKDSQDYPALLSNFESYKNIMRRSIMHAKRDYYHHVFNRYSTNLQKTWQAINETLNSTKGKRDFPQEFQLANGNIISDPKKIANAFNDIFISIGDTGLLNANRNIEFNQYYAIKTNCTLICQAITIDTTSRIIDSLKPKTSTVVDSVFNKLLKFAKNVISEPLTIIISIKC